MITASSYMDALRKLGEDDFGSLLMEEKYEFLLSARWMAIADADSLVYSDDFGFIPTARNASGRKIASNEMYIFTWDEEPYTEEGYEELVWEKNNAQIVEQLLEEEE